VILGLAFRVWSTSGALADISALGHAVFLHALGGFWAIVVDLTLDSSLTSNGVRIADLSWLAETFERSAVVLAGGVRATRRALAEIDEAAELLGISSESGLALADLLVVLGCA
jgi:hypothetical protein